ncbi:MAG: arsenite S-adenosylmethyltransferase [Bacteroidetes bacterium GWE2_41_25]|nr:MAG: arsenite S-adenosylmethyltransferase [Bacteroidetes bacterium GWA2_40_15]OFX94495.1 MAG: arsenite S-adenosylmethyltransferase [Bacteroidetes bacterium GWC2_40_22]OFY11103.1 MAG: arsenite S-adenosylmethyltransferase [Bacteroidetes bacterium GWE2_41_25]OFY58814.1 MAG: arsenite S-adenosylmethyltransferase [Bacteroidetes bacterium GWF2_41_9]HBH83958.1 arsenite S-adenosylmethyltransferase [Bacteroidales bacterium]
MKSEELKSIVKDKYGKIAQQIDQDNSCCGSSSCCGTGVDYTVFSESYEKLEGYNPDADMNLGCGIPTDFAGIKTGDHVLDLGSGAGNDCFVARAIVGEKGKVTGLDMTEPMVLKARENCKKLKYKNVEFVIGDIEDMPFDEMKFDVVISNCVLNLVPDKTKAFSEIFRVLKPGAHFCVSDVVIKGRLSEKMQKDAELYAGCVSGASGMDEYLEIVKDAGFFNIKVHKQKEIKLPDSLLSEYNNPAELNSYHSGERGIFSITVSAYKPE